MVGGFHSGLLGRSQTYCCDRHHILPVWLFKDYHFVTSNVMWKLKEGDAASFTL
jgi:hypothetical protein